MLSSICEIRISLPFLQQPSPISFKELNLAMEQQVNQASFQPPHVQLHPASHMIMPSSGQPTLRTYCHCLTSNEVLSLASRQKQLLEVHVAIAHLNKELPDCEYSAYTLENSLLTLLTSSHLPRGL